MSDLASPSPSRSGARAFSRLDYDPQWRQPEPANSALPTDRSGPAEAATTVTLDKIGDFLELDFGRLFVWVGSGRRLITVLALTGAVAGAGFGVFSTPRYTVTTDIMIDPGSLQVVDRDLFSQPGAIDGQVLNAGSKLRVLTSRNVLSRVVADLDLTADPEFNGTRQPLISLPSFGSSGPAEDSAVVALKSLSEHISTTADEKSFVASLNVSSEDTGKAIAISDGIVKAFKAELADAEADGAARAAASLDSRLGELKADVQQAEQAVEAFRRRNNLSTAADGQLVSTQTMSAINAQVVNAQARLIEAQTAFDSLVAAGPQASPADPSAASSLSALRDKAAALQQQLLSQSMIYGPRHPTIVSLEAERNVVTAQINAEVQRAVNGAKAAVTQAQANLDALTDRSQSLTSTVFSDNALQVQLRELERDAAAKTAVYESFLARAKQITEREQIDTTNVRVISTAVPPPGRSWPPRTVVMIALGAIGGAVLGLLAAIGLGVLGDLRRSPRLRDERA